MDFHIRGPHSRVRLTNSSQRFESDEPLEKAFPIWRPRVDSLGLFSILYSSCVKHRIRITRTRPVVQDHQQLFEAYDQTDTPAFIANSSDGRYWVLRIRRDLHPTLRDHHVQ